MENFKDRKLKDMTVRDFAQLIKDCALECLDLGYGDSLFESYLVKNGSIIEFETIHKQKFRITVEDLELANAETGNGG